MAPSWVRAYKKDKRSQNFYFLDDISKLDETVMFTKHVIVPLPSMEGTNDIWATMPDNFLWITKREGGVEKVVSNGDLFLSQTEISIFISLLKYQSIMNEIQQWLSDSQHDYHIGVALYEKYGKNKSLANFFRTGKAQFRMGKLVYEIGKLVANSNVQIVVAKTIAQPSVRATTQKNDEIPFVILGAKKEVCALYATIDKMHKELYDIGTSNSDVDVKKRKKILDERAPIIERTDKLYTLKEEWFRGNTSVETQIREILSENAKSGKAAETKLKPADISVLNDIQLSKRRSQLRSSITKTQNFLTYQSVKKLDSPSPLPDGPKRKSYEEKLSALKAEYKQVCDELSKRSK